MNESLSSHRHFVHVIQIYIIRMNPFVTSVGACLFTWTDNSKELTKGPIQLRVVDTPRMSPDAFSSYQASFERGKEGEGLGRGRRRRVGLCHQIIVVYLLLYYVLSLVVVVLVF